MIAGLITAITPFMISLSRWAIPPSIVPFCLLAFIFTLIKLIDSNTKSKIILNSSLFTLSGIALTYSYPTMKVFVPLALIALVAVYLYPIIKTKLLGSQTHQTGSLANGGEASFGIPEPTSHSLKMTDNGLNEESESEVLPLAKGLAPQETGVTTVTDYKYFTTFQKLITPILAIFLFISPIYYLTITQPDVYNARYKQVSMTAGGESFAAGFASRYWEYLTPYFLTGYSDSNEMHHVPKFGPINELLTPLIYLGLLVAFWKSQDKQNPDHQIYLYLIILFFLAPVAPSLTIDKSILTRGIQVLLMSLIFIPIAIHWLVEHISLDQKAWKTVTVLFGIISLVTTAHFSFFYFTKYNDNQKGNFQYGIEQMFEYLQANDDKFDKVEIVDINQPYIYKLFFQPSEPGSYDPKIMSSRIGKYTFDGVNKDGLRDKKVLTKWQDGFTIYEYQPRWYIVAR